MKYRLIINGQLQDKILASLNELLDELSNLDHEICYSINWVIA